MSLHRKLKKSQHVIGKRLHCGRCRAVLLTDDEWVAHYQAVHGKEPMNDGTDRTVNQWLMEAFQLKTKPTI